MFMIGVLGMLLFAATDGAFVYFVQKFVKGMTDLQYKSLASANPAIFWLIPIGAPVLFLLRGIGDYMSTYFPGYVGRQVIKGIRADLFRQYLHLPASYYDRVSGGTVAVKAHVQHRAGGRGHHQIRHLDHPRLADHRRADRHDVLQQLAAAAVVFLIAPPLSWLVRKVSSSFRRYSARIQASMGDVTRIVKEALDGQRVIKVFNAQDAGSRRLREGQRAQPPQQHEAHRCARDQQPVVQFIASLALGGNSLGRHAPDRQGHTGAGYVHGLSRRLAHDHRSRSSGSWIRSCRLAQGVAAGASVFEVLDTPSEDFKSGRALGRVAGAVEFRDVTFEYAAEKGTVLNSVSLAVPAGKTVAIVGRSGSGKSTLVALVPRIYDANSGEVLVDGINVRECNLRDLRANVALVSQDVLLFNDSIRNNIAFGIDKSRSEGRRSCGEGRVRR